MQVRLIVYPKHACLDFVFNEWIQKVMQMQKKTSSRTTQTWRPEKSSSARDRLRWTTSAYSHSRL